VRLELHRERALRARPRVILRLADALDVPLRERNALLVGAGYAPAFRESAIGDPSLAPLRAALERVLHGHLPSPAVLTDRNGCVVTLEAFLPADEPTARALAAALGS
jgi:hypothetical protein